MQHKTDKFYKKKKKNALEYTNKLTTKALLKKIGKK